MQKVKENKTSVWVYVAIVTALLFVGLLVVGNTAARAGGGTCIVKIGEFCLKDVVAELESINGVEEEEEALGALVGNELQGNSWTVGERTEEGFLLLCKLIIYFYFYLTCK